VDPARAARPSVARCRRHGHDAIQLGIDRDFADSSPPIRVRIGIHTGDAIQEAEHFFGTTVHFASHALGGEVIVSSLVRREVELKGREGQHRLYPLAPS
jgi:class 3 adenylate cyclase